MPSSALPVSILYSMKVLNDSKFILDYKRDPSVSFWINLIAFNIQNIQNSLKYLTIFFPGGSYKVPCPKCDLTFFNKASLKNHTKAVHLGKSGYTCSICGVRYNSHFGLRRHTNYAHEKNKDIKTRNASKRLLVTGMQQLIL